MSVKNCSILNGATVTATGGTAVTYSPDSQPVVGGIHQIDVAATDYRTMSTMVTKVRQPVYDKSKGLYTLRGKKHLTITFPFILASGVIEFPLIRIEVEDHPEWPAADKLEAQKRGAQVLIDTDFTNFWSVGSQE